MNEIAKNNDDLYQRIAALVAESRQKVKTAVNTAMVYTYYNVGRYIVEYEQQGEQRAAYGQKVLKDLSKRLTEQFGNGWSTTNLKTFRQFYLLYSTNLLNSVEQIQDKKAKHCLPNSNEKVKHCLTNLETTDSELSIQRSENVKPFVLSWSHYLILMRIADPMARSFYEIECQQQDWSVRQLSRQVGSCLYERLALSRDKNEVMRLATEGQTVEKPDDVIKSPLTLEFLGLRADESYSESKLEHAIINKMRDFLLELGKGFLFEARQKRFTFNEEHFFVDLVFYNRLLQCYCLIDLKTNKLTHQDLGQMQMYVNYFDRYVKQPFEKPTIGILLCQEKNDALVNLTLPEDANIYASAYDLYLPDKELLQLKVKEWIEEFEENEELQQGNAETTE